MTELTFLFAAVAVLGGLVTSISIWAPRRLWLARALAGVPDIMRVAGQLAGYSQTLRPRPGP